MSCYVVTKETVSKVARFVAALLNQGFNVFGFSADEFCHQAFKDCRCCSRYDEDMIYHALYNLSYKAYNGRYRVPQKEDYSDEIPKNPELRFWEELERKVEKFGELNHEVVQDWHYEAYKGTATLHYQLCEDTTENDAKVEALDRILKQLAAFIVCHTPIFHTIKIC